MEEVVFKIIGMFVSPLTWLYNLVCRANKDYIIRAGFK